MHPHLRQHSSQFKQPQLIIQCTTASLGNAGTLYSTQTAEILNFFTNTWHIDLLSKYLMWGPNIHILHSICPTLGHREPGASSRRLWAQGRTRCLSIAGHNYSHTHFQNYPTVHVFGLREETRELRENPQSKSFTPEV